MELFLIICVIIFLVFLIAGIFSLMVAGSRADRQHEDLLKKEKGIKTDGKIEEAKERYYILREGYTPSDVVEEKARKYIKLLEKRIEELESKNDELEQDILYERG